MDNKYNFFSIQENIKNLWANNSIFDFDANSKNAFFCIDTPPPTVSGNLHIGHVFSYIHQDIIARYKRMTGFNVVFPFGFDDNGLPTERYIEKKCNISSKKMSKKDFCNICYTEIKDIQERFIELLKKLGLSYDWNLIYSTISPFVQKLSQKNFIDLYKKGYIYKKKEPALYCTSFQTSISQADLEEITKPTIMVTVKFEDVITKENILIATTRPELLAGCVAVLVHPEDIRFSHLVGKKLKVPLYNHEVLVWADDAVIMDKGTGVVMTATFGDRLDVHWFKKYNWEYKEIVNKNGTLSDKTLFLSGMKIEEGRQEIIKKLIEDNLVTKQESIVHRVSIYERSKKEIEYIMLNQWFISLLPYKNELLAIADKIDWHPSYMKIRYIDWVSHLSWDWCISRQRSFGIPFPVWYDKDGNVILADEKNLPCDPMATLPDGYIKNNCNPDEDVMDTWNTSSITPYIIKEMLKEKVINIDLPLDVRPQSHDIIRTWAFDTIVKSFFGDNTIPWKNIVISGHVLASDNQKISKSKENSPLDPENLLKQYPADVIRYWSSTAKLGVDTAFSETQFKDGNKLIIKLWNAAICLKDFADFDSIFKYQTLYMENVRLELNLFFLHQWREMSDSYQKAFDVFDFSSALRLIEKFFWFFCDYYLEIIKIYTKENNFSDSEIQETKLVSAYLFWQILHFFAPFIPFIVDHLWNLYYVKGDYQSLHIMQINKNIGMKEQFLFENNFLFESCGIEIIGLIRKAKSDQKMSLKMNIKKLTIFVTDNNQYQYLVKESILSIIKKMNFIDEIICINELHKREKYTLDWQNNDGLCLLNIYI